MGQHQVSTEVDEERARRFSRALLDDLRTLERMCAMGIFERGVRRIGVEQEMFLVDRTGRPAPQALDLLATLGDPAFTTEIGLHNLELNLAPCVFGPGCFRDMEARLEDALGRAREAAHGLGGDILLAGILPSIELTDLVLANLTPLPRYQELNRLITALAGGAVRTLIQGRDNLQVSLDNVVLETCNTSFQVHMQVDAEEFPRFYNIAQLVSGPMVAAAANSPLLLQHRLWHETRIAAFEQAIDIRSVSNRMRDTWQRVSFGEGWVNDSVVELYQDQVARHRVTLMGETGESSLAQLERGEAPALRALCIHNSSVYRWNRPCYGVLDGRPHLRIEHRPLPAGPTILDEVANAALFLGLLLGAERRYGDVRTRFSFGDVRGNFLTGARYGLNATFQWEAGTTVPARTLITEHLLPMAHDGLALAGVPPEERARYLGVIEARVRGGRNGALWMLEAFEALRDIRSRGLRSQVLTQAVMRRQWTGQPVHEWSLPSPTERGVWTERFQRVAQVMSTDLFTVGPGDLVDVAASLMQWKRIRHVPVEDDQGRLVGLVSYRSLLRLVAEGHAAQPVPVREIMHADPLTVSPGESCLTAMRVMQQRGVACLPVVHEGRLVGIVSERDFLPVARALFEEALARQRDESEPADRRAQVIPS